MERLAEREEEILNFILRDYIRSAQPISSSRISDAGRVEVSPATIRNTMLELDEKGFLEKPHTSAGRVPTDKAYRYFVDFLMEPRSANRRAEQTINAAAKKIRQSHELMFENLSKAISSELKLFTGIASFGDEARVSGFGLHDVLEEPEFSSHDLSVEFAKLVDNLHEVAESYFDKTSLGARAFIGNENPTRDAKSFSSVALKFKNDELGECVVFSLGPKRMNYERAFALLDFAVEDLMESFD